MKETELSHVSRSTTYTLIKSINRIFHNAMQSVKKYKKTEHGNKSIIPKKLGNSATKY